MTTNTFLRLMPVRPNQAGARWLLGLAMLAVLLAAFTSLAFAQGNVLSDSPKNFELVQGWYQGRATFYYDFGANTSATADGSGVVTAPIYVLVTGFDADGNPQVVEGQHNIVDVIPGDAGYSDLWQVTFVTVPADYVANSVTSLDELAQAGYPQTPTETYVNCPIVPAESTLAEGDSQLVQGWYRGQEIFYFDFGQNAPVTAPIYALITGFDANGNPQVVEGQHNIIDVVPGDAGYSAFWDVHFVTVPADYQANSITAAADLLAKDYPVTRAGVLVNCPVVRTEEAAMMAENEDAMMADEGEMMAENEDAMMAASDQQPRPADAPQALPATGAATSNLPLGLVVGLGGLLLAIGLVFRATLAGKR